MSNRQERRAAAATARKRAEQQRLVRDESGQIAMAIAAGFAATEARQLVLSRAEELERHARECRATGTIALDNTPRPEPVARLLEDMDSDAVAAALQEAITGRTYFGSLSGICRTLGLVFDGLGGGEAATMRDIETFSRGIADSMRASRALRKADLQ